MSVSAQGIKREEKPPLRERLFFGGSFGLQFGTITNIDISPIAGLWILPRVAIAGGPSFMYYKFYNDKTSIYGGHFYSQYLLLQDLDNILPIGLHTGIFLHIEDELLSLESDYWRNPSYSSNRFVANNVLLGGGIRQQMGRRSFMHLTALWKISDSGYSIYSDPEIRISFSF
ncbi:MAG: hypothetical protein LBV26_03025 [Bacteroidales bacterium]|jgi:hypothetical protein|nr:hypothetical protein [Bacteroidales bacterium]